MTQCENFLAPLCRTIRDLNLGSGNTYVTSSCADLLSNPPVKLTLSMRELKDLSVSLTRIVHPDESLAQVPNIDRTGFNACYREAKKKEGCREYASKLGAFYYELFPRPTGDITTHDGYISPKTSKDLLELDGIMTRKINENRDECLTTVDNELKEENCPPEEGSDADTKLMCYSIQAQAQACYQNHSSINKQKDEELHSILGCLTQDGRASGSGTAPRFGKVESYPWTADSSLGTCLEAWNSLSAMVGNEAKKRASPEIIKEFIESAYDNAEHDAGKLAEINSLNQALAGKAADYNHCSLCINDPSKCIDASSKNAQPAPPTKEFYLAQIGQCTGDHVSSNLAGLDIEHIKNFYHEYCL